MTTPTPTDPAEAAARWYARAHADVLTNEDAARLDAWIGADAAHGAAWDKVERTHADLGALADDPAIAALRREAMGEQPGSVSNGGRRRFVPWRLAAAAALVAAVGTAGLVGLNTLRPSHSAATMTRYATAVGEIRTIRLPDGTDMTLDAGSQARVAAPATTRQVFVDRGRAAFAVAKDKAHPFVVSIGDTDVTALGTQFSVERRRRYDVVALTEGSVRVVTPAGARALSPGDVLTAGRGRLSVGSGAQEESGWINGRLVFDAVPLSQVADTLNRYDARRLVIRDAALAARPYSGALRTAGGSAALVAALTATGVARVVSEDERSVTLAPR